MTEFEEVNGSSLTPVNCHGDAQQSKVNRDKCINIFVYADGGREA